MVKFIYVLRVSRESTSVRDNPRFEFTEFEIAGFYFIHFSGLFFVVLVTLTI